MTNTLEWECKGLSWPARRLADSHPATRRAAHRYTTRHSTHSCTAHAPHAASAHMPQAASSTCHVAHAPTSRARRVARRPPPRPSAALRGP
eukprot:7223702-Prymnesium_polylepis.2